MKRINFCKYHGCGNDFIIVKEQDVKDLNIQDLTRKVCDRTTGIGADGLLVDLNDVIGMDFFNQDGSHGTMCGNGLRSFCAYLVDQGKVSQKVFDVQTPDSIKVVHHISSMPHIFNVNLGVPSFDPKKIEIKTGKDIYLNEPFIYNNKTYYGHAVYTSVKHLVVFVDDESDLYDEGLGSFLSNNEVFIDRINVDFVKVIDEHNFKMKTYERGVGFTKACGTGACASFVIGKLNNKCKDYVFVHMDLGTLKISQNESEINMEGPAQKICEGIYDYEEN